MTKNDGQRITSCTISRENSGDILRVITRVLPKEIQVRFYSGENLIYGKIWPLSDQNKENLFDILYKCPDDWDKDNYASDLGDLPHWQFKICTKNSCLRTVTGDNNPPTRSLECHDVLDARVRGFEVGFHERGVGFDLTEL